MESSGVEWSAVWSAVECSGVEWRAVEGGGGQWSAVRTVEALLLEEKKCSSEVMPLLPSTSCRCSATGRMMVVFSATYCPFSAAAKRALTAEGVPFTAVEWNETKGGAGFAPALAELTGRSSIPHVFVCGRSVGGCNDGDPGIRPLIASGGLDAALAGRGLLVAFALRLVGEPGVPGGGGFT